MSDLLDRRDFFAATAATTAGVGLGLTATESAHADVVESAPRRYQQGASPWPVCLDTSLMTPFSRYAITLVACALCMLSCGKPESLNTTQKTAIAAPTPNQTPLQTPVLLISCDTLRADRVGAYGHERPSTPNLDNFGKDAVLFENAYTPEVFTLTAHMTMLTGLNPEQHGLRHELNLPDVIRTMPQALQEAGYACGGFVGHEWWFLPSRGYGRGFDEFQTPDLYRPVEETHAEALGRWLPAQNGRPFFLFLHNYDIHSKIHLPGRQLKSILPFDVEDDAFRVFTKGLPVPPFRRPELPEALATRFLAAHNNGHLVITAEETKYMRLAYDECVLRVDHALGKLFEHLKAAPYGNTTLYDAALIIITSDHGESLGDHNAHIHGNVYEENLRIPLLAKFPQAAHGGARIQERVQLADLAPTIMETLAIPWDEEGDGISLLPLLQGKTLEPRTFYARRNLWRSIRQGDLKLHYQVGTDKPMLFDLAEDPGELSNIWDEQEETAKHFGQKLLEYYYPEKIGWRLALDSNPTGWQCTISTQDDAHVVAISTLGNSLLRLPRQLGDSALQEPITLALPPENSRQTLSIRTEPPGATLQVRIDPAPPSQDFSFTLRMDGAENEKPKTVSPAHTPTVAYFYQPPDYGPQGNTKLSPQAIEDLKALGYLDD